MQTPAVLDNDESETREKTASLSAEHRGAHPLHAAKRVTHQPEHTETLVLQTLRRSSALERSSLTSTVSFDVEEAERFEQAREEVDFYRNRLRSMHFKGQERFDDKVRRAEAKAACSMLREALDIRNKYCMRVDRMNNKSPSNEADAFNMADMPCAAPEFGFSMVNGVFELRNLRDEAAPVVSAISLGDYVRDYHRIEDICSSGPVKTYSYHRLKVLEYKYDMHMLANELLEVAATKSDPQDFSTVIKVDTHIHLAAGMTASHLLDFIKAKAASDPEVMQLLTRLSMSPEDLTINSLDVMAENTFQRFDNFNNHYNPFGLGEARTMFLKSENANKGRFFAEITRELFEQAELSKSIKTEYRISIYGRKLSEWSDLAAWVVDFKLFSPSNRWMVQVPRLYDTFKKLGSFADFQQLLEHIFRPLFEVTLNPESNPKLHLFLKLVSGFDIVDDESKLEPKIDAMPPSADKWNSAENPPYFYWMYYMWANIYVLNKFREARGFNTFDFRPHGGESGDVNHLSACFLLARNISHGVNLNRSTSLQYLFYLAQIGIAMSPLSNNSLFIDYKRNPFPFYFKRGLHVSLSTDDPLQFHLTQTPLIEEYSIAAKRWNLNDGDLSEIARNSVYQSGFTHDRLVEWLGPNYNEPGHHGNDINHTNVSSIRVAFRAESMRSEFDLMRATLEKERPQYPSRITWVGLKGPDPFVAEEVRTALLVQQGLRLRDKYQLPPSSNFRSEPPPPDGTLPPRSQHVCRNRDGVFHVYHDHRILCGNDVDNVATVRCPQCALDLCPECDRVFHMSPAKKAHSRVSIAAGQALFDVITVDEFRADYNFMELVRADPPTRSVTARRLKMNDLTFQMHAILNEQIEARTMKNFKKDFYTVAKVDTHVHIGACPTSVHLLNFMKQKFQTESKVVVQHETGTENGAKIARSVTLGEVFARLKVPLENFTLDSLDVKASDTFNRYDRFRAKYNPLGCSDLRSIFLKKDNHIQGRYFAQLVKEVAADLEASRFTFAEYRISVHGLKRQEWSNLAAWVFDNEILSEHIRLVVQVPRNYHVFRDSGDIRCFQDMLDNIFMPLFEVTLNPASDPRLFRLLPLISGFDSVDDESSCTQRGWDAELPLPKDWTTFENPPYSYYLYYMWANIYSLNRLRQVRGLSTFDFRPHSGVAGSRSHLCSAFLLGKSISHGINLSQEPAIQYLYYLAQVGISVSPLGEDALYRKYDDNPFIEFFRIGLNVSLSSDNPLLLHVTDNPLLEEYSTAAKMWRLTLCDLAELARNSVLQSGFSHEFKQHWLGCNYTVPGVNGNDEGKTGVTNIRVHFRHEVLSNEHRHLNAMVENFGHQFLDQSLLGPPKAKQPPSLDTPDEVDIGVDRRAPPAIVVDDPDDQRPAPLAHESSAQLPAPKPFFGVNKPSRSSIQLEASTNDVAAGVEVGAGRQLRQEPSTDKAVVLACGIAIGVASVLATVLLLRRPS
eukprot:TRINITY_DN7192_c0_g3_i2.p1 TRINITY_DN7192_c0_g3~~TRINITY_DN7192_c0_g3_i2.p1  ORF type:complete len:1500 (+),score=445.22 TRINITY_DN7192_c0_g3_i2:106-4500(+)